MQDFETTTDDKESTSTPEEKGCPKDRVRKFFRSNLKRFIMFISFGPGILGFLWLIGRILKR